MRKDGREERERRLSLEGEGRRGNGRDEERRKKREEMKGEGTRKGRCQVTRDEGGQAWTLETHRSERGGRHRDT